MTTIDVIVGLFALAAAFFFGVGSFLAVKWKRGRKKEMAEERLCDTCKWRENGLRYCLDNCRDMGHWTGEGEKNE